MALELWRTGCCRACSGAAQRMFSQMGPEPGNLDGTSRALRPASAERPLANSSPPWRDLTPGRRRPVGREDDAVASLAGEIVQPLRHLVWLVVGVEYDQIDPKLFGP